MPKKGSGPSGSDGDYEVGKGKPPVHSRWKPGECGNPRGRPRKAKNTATIAREALDRSLPVIVHGRKHNMSVRAVAFRKLADKAASGDGKALTLLLSLANQLQSSDPDAEGRTVSSENDAEIIAEFLRRRAEQEDDDQ